MADSPRVSDPISPGATGQRIFISYRRDGSGYVVSVLEERLRESFGQSSVFVDIDAIPLGVDFRVFVESAVAECEVLLVLIDDDWLADERGLHRLENPSDFVRLELETALANEIPIVPILSGPCSDAVAR